jgi:hypothetical protein
VTQLSVSRGSQGSVFTNIIPSSGSMVWMKTPFTRVCFGTQCKLVKPSTEQIITVLPVDQCPWMDLWNKMVSDRDTWLQSIKLLCHFVSPLSSCISLRPQIYLTRRQPTLVWALFPLVLPCSWQAVGSECDTASWFLATSMV